MAYIPQHIEKQLPADTVFSLTQIQSLSADVLQSFSEKEKRELELCTNIKRQQEFFTSRKLLKDIAKDGGISDLEIHKDELGQPYGINGSQKYFVSIAHSRNMVFCGFSEEKAIGVDLEPIDRKVPKKLKNRILHPDETRHISSMEAIQLWTIKEAYIKLRGQGLRMNMNQVHVIIEGENYFVEINNDKKAKICSFQVEQNWLAIAHYL